MVSKVIEGRTSADNPIPAIPEPGMDLASMRVTIMRMREAIQAMTGQRGPRDFDLYQGLRTISRHVSEEGRERHAEIRELNEVIIEGDTVLAQQYTELSAEVVDARQGQPNLSAKVTNLDQARINGDAAIATSVSTLNAEVTSARFGAPNLSASLVNIDTARANGDTALASADTVLTAKYNDISANAQVKIAASGSLWGMSATYSIYLQADAKYAGLSLGVTSGGDAVFIVDASRFYFNNSGTGQTIMSYDAGQFTFNGNVKINGTLVIDETINFPKILYNGISQLVRAEGGVNTGTWIELVTYLGCRAASKVMIIVNVRGAGVIAPPPPPGSTVTVYANGGVVGALSTYYVTVDTAGQLVAPGQSSTFIWVAPSTGTFEFKLRYPPDGTTYADFTIFEITR